MIRAVRRVLVGLHHTELGGSQLNGLDIATATRDRGMHVHVMAAHAGAPGPIADLTRDRGLPLTLVHHPQSRSQRGWLYRRAIADRMTAIVRDHDIDLVHAYEDLILEALYGPHLRLRTRLVGTVYAMTVPTWLPRHTPLVAGTRQIVDAANATGQDAWLIEPPINTAGDDPRVVDASSFCRAYPGRPLYVIVSRLEPDMKQEGIQRTIDAMRVLDGQLVVVGDGPSRRLLEAEAARVNARVNRTAAVIHGPMTDPRPAYAAADVVLGMGGSALRAMSFGKPVVVLGIRGFAREFTPATAPYFFENGFYGIGDGIPGPLASQIRLVLEQRHELGAWSRETVVARYGLEAAAAALCDIYDLAPQPSPLVAAAAALRTGAHKLVADALPTSTRVRLRPVTRPLLQWRRVRVRC
jgi:glycosyltransferase involved in cell wall biosynthesis